MRQPIGAAALSDVIGSIYDCAVDPQRWPETLKHIQNELDFGGASLSVTALPSDNVLLEVMSLPKFMTRWAKLINLTRSKWGRYAAEMWGGLDRIHSLPLGEPIVLSQLRNRSEWTNNPVYRNWGRRFAMHDILAIGLARDSSMMGSLALVRFASQGDIGDNEIEAACLLIPHLQRAVAISKLLDVRSVAAATFETALDTLAVAVILTDADLRIVHANAAAKAMFVSRGSLRSEGGKLALRSSAAAVALAMAVQQAARNEAAIGRRGLGVPAMGADGAPSVLHVLPLNHGELRPGLAPSAVAAIFVAPAVSPTTAPHDAVAALFNLTHAEARVFAQIAEGKLPLDGLEREIKFCLDARARVRLPQSPRHRRLP
jgi:PAS domain-containing protein